MRRISPRRRLPQLLRLLLFIGISSATSSDAAANYTLDESYRAQSLPTSISSPWPSPPTRVRNIKGAVPAKTKSTGDVTSRLLVLVADGDTDATADGLEEIGKKSGGAGDFRDSRDFKADDALRARDYSADFKAGEEKRDFSKSTRGSSLEFTLAQKTQNGTSALYEVSGTRKKRDDWYFAAAPNFWTYQPHGYLYYGFGIPVVLIQWPSSLPMRSSHRVHSPNQNHNANDDSRIKSGVDFDLNYGDDKNFKGKGRFDYEDEDGHDEYDEHIHIDDKDYEEDDVVRNEEPGKMRTGLYSGGGKWRPIFPNKKPGSGHTGTDVKKPLPTPKKRRPLEHWLQHVFPPWPKNRTVISRN